MGRLFWVESKADATQWIANALHNQDAPGVECLGEEATAEKPDGCQNDHHGMAAAIVEDIYERQGKALCGR